MYFILNSDDQWGNISINVPTALEFLTGWLQDTNESKMIS